VPTAVKIGTGAGSNMSITLRPETERLLEERLKHGTYSTADELVHAAINALDELDCAELDDQTLDAIDEAEDQIERGEFHDWEEVREKVRAQFLGE
jgi:putative addiction module CopG family antidote